MPAFGPPAFDQLTLDTDRLHLRPLRDADAPALFAMLSDPLVTRYWSSLPWTSIDQAHAMIARDRQGMADGDSVRLALERREDGRFLGMCTLFAISAQCRRAEIGYALLTDAGRQGYMDEALRSLLAYGFDVLGLNRVEADIDPRNVPSARTLERLGFTQDGLQRERWIVGDEVSDSALYGLLAREWRRDT
ncbi:GNAT family N-acetyltransferase [Roseateles aquatilis]|uniref:GNAT family N-acetyltransferase n=1 Tax=Roseateles aquatilis TaxID=431061 RepID=A0A246IZJ0_9BURK|nr:GNAT family N-acetyltransferase [Roseateles aquatilis]OWQ85759.1 GNAT family N-acetyltransferase [Roseateles aquatilis]